MPFCASTRPLGSLSALSSFVLMSLTSTPHSFPCSLMDIRQMPFRASTRPLGSLSALSSFVLMSLTSTPRSFRCSLMDIRQMPFRASTRPLGSLSAQKKSFPKESPFNTSQAASLRRYYPPQVQRVKSMDSLSFRSPSISLITISNCFYNYSTALSFVKFYFL